MDYCTLASAHTPPMAIPNSSAPAKAPVSASPFNAPKTNPMATKIAPSHPACLTSSRVHFAPAVCFLQGVAFITNRNDPSI
jgi:hypothetical protein